MAASINVSNKMKNEQYNTVGIVVEKEAKHILVYITAHCSFLIQEFQF